MKTTSNFTMEQLIHVGQEEPPAGTLALAPGDAGLSLCLDVSDPGATAQLSACAAPTDTPGAGGAGGADGADGGTEHVTPLIEIRLTKLKGAGGDLKPGSPSGSGGLVYRLPLTALIQLEVRNTSNGKVLARQVRAVAFPQLGSYLRAPQKIKGRKGHVNLEVSEKTGMLQKVEYSSQPQPTKEEAAAASAALKGLAGEAAKALEKPSATERLEEENKLLRLQRENECLREGRTDC